MMDSPRTGTKVHVEFDGYVAERTEYDSVTGNGWIKVRSGGDGYYHFLWHRSDAYTVTEKPTPLGWPPRAGDIWTANGTEYFVYAFYNEIVVFPVEAGLGLSCYYSSEHGKFKALNPVLTRRR